MSNKINSLLETLKITHPNYFSIWKIFLANHLSNELNYKLINNNIQSIKNNKDITKTQFITLILFMKLKKDKINL